MHTTCTHSTGGGIERHIFTASAHAHIVIDAQKAGRVLVHKGRCMRTDKNTCIDEIGYMLSHARVSTLTLMLSKMYISVYTEVGGAPVRPRQVSFHTPSDVCR